MASLQSGLRGCYRCAYVWRPVRAVAPRLCPRCKSRLWDVPILRRITTGRGQGVEQVLSAHRTRILSAARRQGFNHVRVFGSVRRAEATRSSDVDLLVARDPGTSLLNRAALTVALERILHRKVDVVPEEALHWLIRPQVLFEAVPL